MAGGERRKLLIVVPCFNEQEGIRELLQSITQYCPEGDLLVIDDGSRDGTAQAAKSFADTLTLPVNLGIGGAVQTGIRYAHDHGYQWCLQLDGDGQHPPQEIQKFLQSYAAHPCNVIIGSRFVKDQTADFRSTLSRRIGIAVIRYLVRLTTQLHISDPTSGFRLLDRRALEVFSEDYSRDFPEPISLAIAADAGLSVAEIPVAMEPRKHGKSSISGFKNLAYMVRVCCYLIAVRLRRAV